MNESHITIIKMVAFDREVIDHCVSEVAMNKDDVKDFVFKRSADGYPISSQHFVVKSKEIKVYPKPKSVFEEIKNKMPLPGLK